MTITITVPDIGDFESVEVIDILVTTGAQIEKEQPLITLESDKATMDIPSTAAGIVTEICIKVGQHIAEGDVIIKLKLTQETGEQPATPATSARTLPVSDLHAEIVVIGAGPGGYTAAFRAAALGKNVVLIERYPTLGGVCLNVGCIPSKALLHVSKVLTEIEEFKQAGVDLATIGPLKPTPIRKWTESVIEKLTSGLASMARQRQVEVIQASARFRNANSLELEADGKVRLVSFDHAIIAAGSRASHLPFLPKDPRILDSTSALLLETIPERMLVIGGGIIGLEMATVYAALGSRITVVEMLDSMIAGCDKDIVRPLHKRIKTLYENIYLGTAVKSVDVSTTALTVRFDGKDAPETDEFDTILVAVGRQPNGNKLDADKANIHVDAAGYIPVDNQQRTNVPNIFAIGDITGQPMLAHKATHEGKLAAEVIAEHKATFDDRVIPSVAYTDPEIAWVGLSETQAKQKNIPYEKGLFPWAASGRSLAIGRDEGMTKLIFDPDTQRLLGAAIVGSNAGDLIAECALAIEMGSDAEDLGLTIHPHPTLSETVAMAAEAFSGTITDLYLPKS